MSELVVKPTVQVGWGQLDDAKELTVFMEITDLGTVILSADNARALSEALGRMARQASATAAFPGDDPNEY